MERFDELYTEIENEVLKSRPRNLLTDFLAGREKKKKLQWSYMGQEIYDSRCTSGFPDT